jgi:hypothetical protein
VYPNVGSCGLGIRVAWGAFIFVAESCGRNGELIPRTDDQAVGFDVVWENAALVSGVVKLLYVSLSGLTIEIDKSRSNPRIARLLTTYWPPKQLRCEYGG